MMVNRMPIRRILIVRMLVKWMLVENMPVGRTSNRRMLDRGNLSEGKPIKRMIGGCFDSSLPH